MLARTLHRKCLWTVLEPEEVPLAVPHAVLAGAGPADGDRASYEAVVERNRAGAFVRVVGVDQDREMEIAVAHMADQRSQQRGLREVALGLGDRLGQARDRHARVGGEAARAGAQGQGSLVGTVTGAPQGPPLGLVGGPAEAAAAVLGGDLADLGGLRRGLGRGAVELE